MKSIDGWCKKNVFDINIFLLFSDEARTPWSFLINHRICLLALDTQLKRKRPRPAMLALWTQLHICMCLTRTPHAPPRHTLGLSGHSGGTSRRSDVNTRLIRVGRQVVY